MGLISGVAPQETFPLVDLSDDNAGLLSLMLSNRELLDSGHDQAEGSYPLFRIAHPVLLGASVHLDVANSARQALDAGIKTYETIAVFVRLQPPERDLSEVIRNSACITVANKASWYKYLEEADAHFRGNLPNTRAVVSEATGRFYPNAVTYALLGASLACQFEIDTANDTLVAKQ